MSFYYSWRHNLWDPLVFVNFSSQDASILKISVPISKRRSWGFQNTPNLQSSDYFEPGYSNSKKAIFNQNYFGKLLFSLNCNNLAQNNPNFTCFGILRTSSCWWALRFLKLMHPGQRNCWKRGSQRLWRQLFCLGACLAKHRRGLLCDCEIFANLRWEL